MTYRPTQTIHMGGEKLNKPDTEYVIKEVSVERVMQYVQAIKLA